MKKRHFTRLSAFALAAALSVITASTPFSDAFPITASVTVSAADETAEGGSTSSQNEVTFTVSGGTPGFANEGPDKLIDGKYTKDNFTKWCCSFSNSAYAVFSASEPVFINGYSIVTGNDNSQSNGRNPKSWVLYGSDTPLDADAEGWEVINKVENDTMLKDLNYTKYDFPLASSTTKKYKYFKFVVNAIQSGYTLQMSELILDYSTCDHQWEDTQEVHEATCTEGAYKIQKCSVCKMEKKVVTSEPLGHKYNENDICTVCGEKRSVKINEENFPDANFRNWILEQNYGQDGVLTVDEIAAVTKINVPYEQISDLKGIEYFTALTSLYCYSNKLTSLDVSKNTALTELDCNFNELTSLDVSNNTALTSLNCQGNQLTSLDVSKNTTLTLLGCQGNQLTSLDVSKNTNLEWLYCNSNNLTSLDVSKNTALAQLYCQNNPLVVLKASSGIISCNAEPLSAFAINDKNEFDITAYGGEASKVKIVSGGSIDENGIITLSGNKATYEYKINDDITITCSIVVGTAINEENFPDEKFRNWILAQKYGEDGALTAEEIAAVTEINVSNKSISDLTGIEYFTALTSLNCEGNPLTSLDVSNNTALTELDCSYNQLTSLDVSNNTALTSLNCDGNQLTSLDVSKNTALTLLDCSWNQITSLDVSKNTALTKLDCSYNKLTLLDLSNNTALTLLNCDGNKLTSLDVSKNTALTLLYCSWNQLTSLDVSKNTALTLLYCSYNKLTSLDVSKNTALIELNCYSNKLTSLDLSNNTNLTLLDCHSNKLTSLDLSKNTNLTRFDCTSNDLTSLDLSKNTNLTRLDCSWNQLTSLDVSKNTALTELNCGVNLLTSLDVSQNTALKYLHCYSNRLTTLDIRGNTNVKSLACDDNPLVVLNCGNVTVSNIAASPLSMLEINDADTFDITKYGGSAENIVSDSITGGTIDKNGIITPNENSAKVTYKYKYNDNGDTITCSIAFGIAIDKVNFPDENFRNWLLEQNYGEDGVLTAEEIPSVEKIDVSNKFISDLTGIEYFTSLKMLYCSSNDLTSLDVSKNTALTELDCSWNLLTSLDVSKNTALTSLNCSSNQLTSLDVSKNTALTSLNCSSNQLTSLDLSNNTALTELNCHSNKLTSLDLSKNTTLTVLYCYYNNLTSLDLSKNTALTELDCHSNNLTLLDVSKSTALTELDCRDNNLTSLDVSKSTNLIRLYCSDNQLTLLDLSKNTALTELDCSWNLLTSLDVSKNKNLTRLECQDNPLTSLDLKATKVMILLANTLLEEYAYKTVFVGGKLDLTTLDGFDVSKASEWRNVTIEGNVISIIDPTKPVTYTYDTGKGNVRFMIVVESVSLTADMIEKISDQTYTGKEFEPKPVVKCGNYTLVEGTDYTLSYDKNTEAGTGKVIVTAKGDFYTGSAEAEFKINKATPAEIILPTASGLTYGQELSESVLSDENWKWVDGKVIPTVNNDGYEASIIVDDKNYDYSDVEGYNEKDHTVTRTIEVTVKKATPAEIIPPTASGLTYGQKLSESVLSDENWKWVDGTVIPTVKNDGYEAAIEVDDKNYDYSDVEGYNEEDHTVTRTIKVTVSKAEPKEIVPPTASGLTYGQKLSESVLSDENWSWVDGDIIPEVENDGFKASITVDDKNYDYSDVEGYNKEDHTVTRIIEVTVKKADPTVNPVIDDADYEDGDDLPEIKLSENDTLGKVEWIEKIAKLVEGKNILDWKFTPENENYNDVTGTLIVNAKATTTITTTVTITTTTAQSTTEKTTTNTSKATTKATTASTTKPTAVSTTKATTTSATQPTTTVSTTKATTANTTKATTVSTTKATTSSTTQPTTASTTKATTASTTKSTTTVSTTKATVASATKPTTVSTTKATTASATKPTTVSTTKATTTSATKPTTVSTTKATTANTTKATTVSTTKATTASATKPTTAVSTTKETVASATKPTTAVSTTKVTTASTAQTTTSVSTTKATTASTTKPTTAVSTTKATTASATKPTTVSTTKATTANTTKATTVSTTKATTANTTVTTVSSSTSTSTSVSTTATSTTSTPTTTTVPPTTTPQVTEVLGDANDDGKLDVRDAAHIARMLAQRNADKLPAKADFNGDGKTDVRDAAAIARFLAKKH